MKIIVRKPTLVEIGSLDRAMRLPISGRVIMGMETKCSHCDESITDNHFICAFKKGWPNMALHERCIDEHTRALVLESLEERKES